MASIALLIDRDIPEVDERILRTICGDAIPNHVRAVYWHYISIKRKGSPSGACNFLELSQVVLLARLLMDEAPAENLIPFNVARWAAGLDQFARNDVRLWFKKKEVRAQFIEHFPERKETKVLLYDNPDIGVTLSERTVPDDRILGPWPVEETVEA